MNEDIKAQFKTEGEPAFPQVADTEKDNSADSSTEEETTDTTTQSSEGEENSNEDDTTSEDDNKEDGDDTSQGDGSDDEDEFKGPFHKHPRWIQRENDLKKRFNDQEKRHVDDLKKIHEETDRKIQEALGNKGDDDTSTELPEWWAGDEGQFKQFEKYLGTLTDKARESAISEMKQKSEGEQKRIDDATEYFNSEVTEIETDNELNPSGVKVDRNKLLKFALDNELVDTQGRWNYKVAWRLMQAGVTKAKTDSNKKKIDEKKKVAGATTTERGAEPAIPTVKTSKDFENPSNRPW
jgi:hypothetical protein